MRFALFFYFFLLLLYGCSFSSANRLPKDAAIKLEQKLVDEQINRLPRSSKKVPDLSIAHYNFLRGELALKESDVESAIVFYEKAAKYEHRPAKYLRLRLSDLYITRGKLKKALKQIELANADQSDPHLTQLQAEILSVLGNGEKALPIFSKLSQTPGANQENASIMLASIYSQNQKIEKAISTLKEFLKTRENSLLAYYYLGLTYKANKDYELARECYEKALLINSNVSFIKIEMAELLYIMGEKDEAIEFSKEILKKNPRNTVARAIIDNTYSPTSDSDSDLPFGPAKILLQTAALRLEVRDFRGAKNNLYFVLHRHPQKQKARYYLASVLAGLKEYDLAVEQLKSIPAKQDLYRDARTFATYILQSQSKYEEAISMLDELIEYSESENQKLLNLLFVLQREAEQDKDSIKTLLRLIELDPNNDRYLFSLGALYDQNGEKKRSITALRRAIELNSQNAEALNYLGYSYADQGIHLDEALELIQQAITLEPNNAYYIDSLGWAYFKLSKPEEALLQLSKAVKLEPNDAVILEHLAIVYHELGHNGLAKKYYKKSLANAPKSEDKKVAERVKKSLKKL